MRRRLCRNHLLRRVHDRSLDVTTTLESCDAALEEGRRLVVEHEMALPDAPTSGIDAVVSAHCMDWDDLDAQAQRLHDALRAEVCIE